MSLGWSPSLRWIQVHADWDAEKGNYRVGHLWGWYDDGLRCECADGFEEADPQKITIGFEDWLEQTTARIMEDQAPASSSTP